MYKMRYSRVPTVRWMRMKVRGMSSAAGTAATARTPGCYQAARHRKEQDGVGQHAPGFDAYRAETDESEEDGAEYDEKDDSEKCGDERRRIGENPVSAVADEGVP